MPFARSRREFLLDALAAGLTVSVGSAVATRVAPLRPRSVSWLDVHDFAPLRGRRVRLHAEDGRVLAARVVDVERRDTRHRGVEVEQISVLVRTGLREPIAQGRFALESSGWGRADLFMVPVVSRSRAIHYEASISRLVG